MPNPANPQDLNRYSYTRNNPLRYVDPSGHDPISEWIQKAVDKFIEISRRVQQQALTPSNWFSEEYGGAIAQRSRELVQLSDSGEIQVERDMFSTWGIEELGEITNYVCADVALDAYHSAGINLQELLLTSEVSSNWEFPEAAPHNAQAFGQYLAATGQLREGDNFPYYQGEIIIGYPDWAHAAVVVQGGHDENNVRLVQASYGRMIIEETTLADWKSRGPGDYVWHGHPSQEELERIR